MTRFIVRRLLVTIPVLLGIVFVVFILARVVPGDPCRAVLGERATDAVCNDFIRRYGLDKAIAPGLFKAGSTWEFRAAEVPATLVDNQFTAYLGQLSRGDLGTSIKHSRPVARPARRTPAHHHRAHALGDAVRHRGRRPARPVFGVPPQLPGRRRIDGLRQPRRIDAGLRAWSHAGIPLRDRPEGHAVLAAPIGPAQFRRGGQAARRGMGPGAAPGAASRPAGLPVRASTRSAP